MKLAFSTLGCPQWSAEQIMSCASDLGYDGVEWRVYLGSLDLVQAFSRLPDLRRSFSQRGLAIPCVDTSVTLAAHTTSEQVALGRDYIGLAASLEAPFVRVFGGPIPDGETWEDTLCRASRTLAELAAFADQMGVTVLLETHDSFSRGAQVAELLDRVPSDAAGALWDVHHPYSHHEPLAETLRLLGPRLRFVHLKDARSDGRLVLPGEGDVPLREAVAGLTRIGYDGYVSFEWEKAWHPEIEEPEVALPAFVTYMRALL